MESSEFDLHRCADCGGTKLQFSIPSWFRWNREKQSFDYVEHDPGALIESFYCEECTSIDAIDISKTVRVFEIATDAEGKVGAREVTDELRDSVDPPNLITRSLKNPKAFVLSQSGYEVLSENLLKKWDWESDNVSLKYRIISSEMEGPIELEARRR